MYYFKTNVLVLWLGLSNWLIGIKCLQNKMLCLHNIVYMCVLYIYIYIYI